MPSFWPNKVAGAAKCSDRDRTSILNSEQPQLSVIRHQPAYDTWSSTNQQMWSQTALGLSCLVERKIHQLSDDSHKDLE